MKSKFLALVLILSIVLSLCTSMGAITASAEETDYGFMLEVGDVFVTASATSVWVPITITKFFSNETIGCLSVRIKYDKTKLTSHPDGFFTAVWSNMISNPDDLEFECGYDGTIDISYTSVDGITSEAISENNLFCSIRFEILDEGRFQTPIEIEATSRLVNSDAVTLVSQAVLANCLKGGSVERGYDSSISGSCGDNVSWSIDANGVLTISGSGMMEDVITYDAAPWYYHIENNNIKSVIIEEGVTNIGDNAFYGCSSLTSITIPDSVTSIGDNAFYGCSGLENVNISDLSTWCSIDFFNGSSNPLSNGAGLYLNEELLTKIIIPDGVESIEDNAFYGYDNLTDVTISDSVKSISDSAFLNCCNLENVIFINGLTEFGSAFKNNISLKSITLGNGITEISDYAFDGCTALENIVIPDSVTSIGNYAFSDCSSLTSITIPDSVTSIGESILYNCPNLITISVPFVGASRDAGGAADGVFGYLFGKSSTASGNYVVANQYYSVGNFVEYTIPSKLKKVYITDATSIPYGSFEGCIGIEYIEINDGVTSISQYAFAGADFLDVKLPKSLTRIGSNAFHGTDVTLHVAIDSYGQQYAEDNNYNYVLYDYYPVTGVELDKTSVSIVEGDTYKLTALVKPDNATYTTVKWTSSDETVATVSEDGTVTAINRGEAIITATTDENGKTASCNVTVTRAVTSVELNHSTLNIGVGNSKTLTATVYPMGATNQNVIWSTSDTEVAIVAKGIVTAVGMGTAVITATTEDGGYTAQCVVNSQKAVTGITLNKAGYEMYVGDNFTLVQTIAPSDAYDKSVIWTSTDANVASVDDSGKVTANAAGTATITATTNDGGYEAKCVITVKAISTDEPADPTKPMITASTVKVTADSTITVTIDIANNPGFANLGIEVGYDTSVLTLTSAVGNTNVGATFTPAQSYSKVPFNMGWDSTTDVYYNGNLATLTFTVAADAPDGVYPISVSYYKGNNGTYADGYDVNYNAEFESIGLNYVNGNVVVISYIPGDVNGDGAVTSRDGTYLLRYLAGWEVEGIVEAALDVDGSGSVTNRDGTTLLRYLAGWDIELH